MSPSSCVPWFADAPHAVGALLVRLGEQIDIDALARELTDVLRRTMQPANVSPWMR